MLALEPVFFTLNFAPRQSGVVRRAPLRPPHVNCQGFLWSLIWLLPDVAPFPLPSFLTLRVNFPLIFTPRETSPGLQLFLRI